MNDGSTQPIIHIPWYRTRWFKRSLFGIVLLAIIAGGIAATVFTVWWNGPEKALLDAANYSLDHSGRYHVVAQKADVTVVVGEDKYSLEGTLDGVQLAAILDGSTLYVKSPEPVKLYQLLMGANGQLPAAAQTIATTVRDKWVAVNRDTVTLQAAGAQKMQCMVEEKESIATDPHARGQWRSTYLAHRFLSVQMAKKSNTTTYDVSVDTKTRQDFFAALLKTSFYQTLTNCSQTTDILSSIEGASPVAQVMLTSKHVFQSATLNPRGQDPVHITASYSDVPKIVVPTDAMSLDQLLFGLLGSFNGL